MHLGEDMAVVEKLTVSDTLGQLGINYVTTINAEDQNQAQIVHYCEAVPIKNEYENVSKRLVSEQITNVINDNVSSLKSQNGFYFCHCNSVNKIIIPADTCCLYCKLRSRN